MGVLDGRTAIVTGAGRGIGRAIAVALAEAGANVAVNSYTPERAESVAEECRQHGVKAEAFPADVSAREPVEQLLDRVEASLGEIDTAVSNAAYSDREVFYNADLDGFERTIAVSMWGPFHLLRGVSRRMIERSQGGSFVTISSPHAVLAIPGAMAYNMAKAAIDQMSRTAAVELAEHRIRVNIVHPGWIDTPGERKFFSEETLREKGAELPWGRLGKPEEIARGVVFLCDPASEYITGSTLTIDGGIQLPWRDMFRLKEASEAETSA